VAYKPKKGPEPDPDVAGLLERGMKYVDEWAQTGSDKPATAKPGPAPKAESAPKPVTAARTPVRVPVKPAAVPPAKAYAVEAPKAASEENVRGEPVQSAENSPPAGESRPAAAPASTPKDTSGEADDVSSEGGADSERKNSPSS